MHSFHGINPWYSLAGFLIAVVVGMTGVGGGSLMTPVLVLLFGVHPTTAVGTDLLFAAVTKTVGTAVHGFSGTVDWRIVRRMAAGSVPATAATLLILGHFRGHLAATAGSNNPITTVLGIALILTAVSILFRKWIVAAFARRVGDIGERPTKVLTVVLGAVLGVLVSVSSVGAGAIGVTFLLMLYPRMPAGRLVGSDIAHAVPLTLVAGLGHWYLGSIDWVMLASLLVGSIPGIVLGSLVAARVPDRMLRPVLAATLAVVGSKLL
jgi:uncharacterized protein